MKKIWIIAMVTLVFAACNSSVKNKESDSTSDAGSILLHKVKVSEVVQTSKYTYLKGTEGGKEYWMAISKEDVKTGEELFYFSANVTPMENFHSTELERDFDKILFISKISRESNGGGSSMQSNPHAGMSMDSDPHAGMGMGSSNAHTGRKQTEAEEGIHVEKAQGGLTIAELYENAKSYAGEKVKVRGVVVKVNNQIMGRNWVHIQDGTKYGKDYDLTCTTQDEVIVNDEVTIEGEVAIDKDFTSGYFYPVIIENTKVLK